MRFWLERRYADWAVDPIRSGAMTTPWGRFTYPPSLTYLVVTLGFFGLSIIVVGYPFTADAAALLIAIGIASVALAAWRIVGECLPGSSVLRWMLVTRGSSTQVPRSRAEREAVVAAEWERRVGATASRSMSVARARSRLGLVVLLVGVSLVQVMTVLNYAARDSPLTLFTPLVILGFVLAMLWALARARRAVARLRRDLADALGVELPPGLPPGDPDAYRAWIGSAGPTVR